METSSPKQYLGFSIAPQAGRETRNRPRLSLALSPEPLTKLPLFKQRKNLIQQDAENCQQKKSSPPRKQCEASVKVEGVGVPSKSP
jgi:hypothetical protein